MNGSYTCIVINFFFKTDNIYTESSGHSTYNVNSCMMHRRVNQFMIFFQASVEACHVHKFAQARPCNAMHYTSLLLQ